MVTSYIINPFTEYQDWFEIIERLNKWELRIITNKRLWELIECEEKIKNIDNVLRKKQYHNSITLSN